VLLVNFLSLFLICIDLHKTVLLAIKCIVSNIKSHIGSVGSVLVVPAVLWVNAIGLLAGAHSSLWRCWALGSTLAFHLLLIVLSKASLNIIS